MVDRRRCLIPAAALLLALAGCAQQPAPFRADVPVNPPPGWLEYCRQAPTDSDCAATKGKH